LVSLKKAAFSLIDQILEGFAHLGDQLKLASAATKKFFHLLSARAALSRGKRDKQ
jgi:hypothetical protein